MNTTMKKSIIAIAATLSVIIIILIIVLARNPSEGTKSQPKLLIILVDGFRYDYVERDDQLCGFPRIRREGIHASYNEPIYPASSYPNWYTVATGLFGESHGMVDNYMYDRNRDAMFLMAPNEGVSNPFWWNQTQPIWTLATKNNKNTAMFNWDGCEIEIDGIRPAYCLPYMKYKLIEDKVDNLTVKWMNEALEGFKNNTYQLSMIYYEPVDHNGHHRGPDSKETREAVRRIDGLLNQLMDKINEMKLKDEVNVYIVSDHGMSTPHTINFLDDLIPELKGIKYVTDMGALAMIEPENGTDATTIKEKLKGITGLTVYLKEEVPEVLHIKNNERTLPLVLKSDPGFLIGYRENNTGIAFPSYISYQALNSSSDHYVPGHHGYFAPELKEMMGIAYAFGPGFKAGSSIGVIKQVDHYQVFCSLLQLTPHPNNGTWDTVKPILHNH